jgi:hypothetical protein
VSDEPQPFIPPTLLGTVYWKDHVVAVVDDPAEAERAAAALVAAGFAAADTRAWRGAFVTENHAYFLEHRSALQRLGALLPSDEGEIGEAFLAEARRGHSILTVRAPSAEQATRASEVLRRHHAHHLKHYRANTVADL